MCATMDQGLAELWGARFVLPRPQLTRYFHVRIEAAFGINEC